MYPVLFLWKVGEEPLNLLVEFVHGKAETFERIHFRYKRPPSICLGNFPSLIVR